MRSNVMVSLVFALVFALVFCASGAWAADADNGTQPYLDPRIGEHTCSNEWHPTIDHNTPDLLDCDTDFTGTDPALTGSCHAAGLTFQANAWCNGGTCAAYGSFKCGTQIWSYNTQVCQTRTGQPIIAGSSGLDCAEADGFKAVCMCRHGGFNQPPYVDSSIAAGCERVQ